MQEKTNMRLNKTLLTFGLATALLQMPATTFAQSAGASSSTHNPLLVKSTLPFGAPDFNKIQESDYLPAFEIAIKSQRENMAHPINQGEDSFILQKIYTFVP